MINNTGNKQCKQEKIYIPAWDMDIAHKIHVESKHYKVYLSEKILVLDSSGICYISSAGSSCG